MSKLNGQNIIKAINTSYQHYIEIERNNLICYEINCLDRKTRKLLTTQNMTLTDCMCEEKYVEEDLLEQKKTTENKM